ncbi:MAG: hypothetical protein F2799_05055 [Actinobacteria bacterium]|uniref:Unannotated protein n=1 Tax=freshwater metagenome TaxID=449393 RepID=A0A6J7DYN8_9ZZZZ|nr:hypothetical protein [Actinomycetota bacterium]
MAEVTELDAGWAIDLGGSTAVFTLAQTREAGHSLDLAMRNPERGRHIAEILKAHGVQGFEIASINQVHGTAVAEWHGPQDAVDADAVLVADIGVAAVTVAADCLPVVLAATGIVVAVHVGWRGLAAGVLESAVDALRRRSGEGDIVAALGPCAGPCCYEVSREVLEACGADSESGAGHLDLRGVASGRLEARGVATVAVIDECTICSGADRFFSYRRQNGTSGRQGVVAWLN